MRMRVGAWVVAVCGFGLFTPPLGAQARAGATSASISASDLRHRLYIYADDSMLGRRAGELGNVRATNYLAAELARIGLMPAGDSGTYFQTVPFVRPTLDSTSTLIANGKPLALWTEYAPVHIQMYRQLTVGEEVMFDGAPAIFGGTAGDSTTTLTTDQARGRLVVFSAPVDSLGRPRLAVGAWSFAHYSNAKAIAVALLDYAIPLYMRSLQSPGLFMDDDSRPRAPNAPFLIVMTRAGAAAMFGRSLDSLSVGATSAGVSGRLAFRRQPVQYPARNVVAVLPGSDPSLRNEYVAIGAHNDHNGVTSVADHDSIFAISRVIWPQGLASQPVRATPEQFQRILAIIDSLHRVRPPRPDSVNNGADDDGSGTVAALELAEAVATASPRPRRSMLFVWHTAEELGPLGSRWFTDHPTLPRDAIVAQLNMDMIGRGQAGDIPGGGPQYLQLIGSRRLSTELGDLVEATNTSGNHGFRFDYQFDAPGHPQRFYCRSDHWMYARYGIPVVFFTTGSHPDYHLRTDEPQYIAYDHLERVTRLVHDVALRVANLDHRVVVDKPKPDPNAACVQ